MGERLTEVKFIVSCGSAGTAPNPEFDDLKSAIDRYYDEIAIPSYMGDGHKRRAQIIRREIIVEDVTPTERKRFEITYDDPETGDQKTVEGVYYGHPDWSAKQSAEDHAYSLSDKHMGSVTIRELPL